MRAGLFGAGDVPGRRRPARRAGARRSRPRNGCRERVAWTTLLQRHLPTLLS